MHEHLMVRFTVPGEPVSKARPRFGKNGHTYTPKTTEAAEAKVAWWFKNAAPGWVIDEHGHYGIYVKFVAGTRRRRDADNMLKLVMDGLNMVAWRDDYQCKEIVARTDGYDKANPHTEVTIYRL